MRTIEIKVPSNTVCAHKFKDLDALESFLRLCDLGLESSEEDFATNQIVMVCKDIYRDERVKVVVTIV